MTTRRMAVNRKQEAQEEARSLTRAAWLFFFFVFIPAVIAILANVIQTYR